MRFLPFVAAALVAATPLCAQENADSSSGDPVFKDRKVFVLGGRLGEEYMESFFNPFGITYENTLIVGAGYQQFLLEPFDDFRLGAEVGMAGRFGPDHDSAEIWGGVVGRYDGWVIGDALRISPAVTFGMSLVTDTTGVERQRAEKDGMSGDLVFYLSPEISVSLADNPNAEAFWRLHHRSPAWNTIGGGSANATTIGVRYGF